MLIGPHASPKEREQFAELMKPPRNYIAQPTLSLSRVRPSSTIILKAACGFAAVHSLRRGHLCAAGRADARCSEKDSLVVNSSQSGGSRTLGAGGEREEHA
jgi:uncharacterized circularly permuted ATP-grasp superfamily protein